MYARRIDRCRLCNNTLLEQIIDLGPQAIQGAFPPSRSVALELPRVPMSLVYCQTDSTHQGCGHLQTEYSIPQDLMYREYWYRSGVTQSMRQHLAEVAATLEAEFNLTEEDSILDIGCNDGTLLRSFNAPCRKVGVDPSNVIPESSEEIRYYNEFFPSSSLSGAEYNRRFLAVATLAMYYDAEDPVYFAKEVKRLLSSSGLWVVEVSYMPKMIEEGWYDSICHEHLSYFSLSTLEKIFAMAELKIVSARLTATNGGSIICYVTHEDNERRYGIEAATEIVEIREYEAALAISDSRIFVEFQRRASEHRDDLRSLLERLEATNKPLRIYGASTKGNTLLQWLGLSFQAVDAAVDRDNRKAGRYTPGTGVSIVSEGNDSGDFRGINLVLPWHFRGEILSREESSLAVGQSFIFPFPQISIVGDATLI